MLLIPFYVSENRHKLKVIYIVVTTLEFHGLQTVLFHVVLVVFVFLIFAIDVVGNRPCLD